MKQPLYSAVYLLLPVFLCVHCAPVKTSYPCGLSRAYAGKTTASIEKDSLMKIVAGHCLLFHDTLEPDSIAYLWDLVAGSKKADTEFSVFRNIPTFAALCTGIGYNVMTMQPVTYESVYALSKLPVLLWLVVVHYPAGKPALMSGKELSIYQTALLKKHAASIRIHCITSLEKTGDAFLAVTREGLVFNGLPNDTMQGQIVTESPDMGSHYVQVVDCLCISLLPEQELALYLDDWYRNLSYVFVKPEIHRLQY